MDQYTVSGRFQRRDGRQPFEKTVEAENDAVARERTYALFGSQHGLKRGQVDIQEVSEA